MGFSTRRLTVLPALAVAATLLTGAPPPASADPDPPPVLTGDTWLTHHRDDLMPYWDLPEAYGDPVGNFPSFRGRAGELLTGEGETDRAASTLGRGVYGYSLAFHLTGDERYLELARAGLDWIETHLEDPVHGGYFGELDVTGAPIAPDARKDLFDLASVALGYAMYFNVTRDPGAEQQLLAIRDLAFGPYYDPAENRLKDALDATLATEVDTAGNGGDITNYLVPGTAFLLPAVGLLSDPARNEQFLADLRNVTQALIDRHKNTAATNPANRWLFWGRTGRFGNFNSLQTDFGHTIKSYAMIHNANQLMPDRPWDVAEITDDRAVTLARAWDDAASRWNLQPRNFAGNVEPDSPWWMHDEADQLLAAMNLTDGFANTERLARSAQTFLDIYVDRDPAYPVRETFTRVSRDLATTDLRKSFFGKNMLHNNEHALILYLHGRALEGRPARLHYAFPHDRALTAVARPYWFDASGQSRTRQEPLDVLPGHDHVTVDFTGIGQAARPPYPPPEDSTAPTTTATVTPEANRRGWHRDDVTVALSATDDLAGVKEVHVQVGDTASIRPGGETSVVLTGDGIHEVTFWAVDALGNAEAPQTVRVRIDGTPPALSGLPDQDCRLWPPNHRFVRIAAVHATDDGSGVAHLDVDAASSDRGLLDIVVLGRHVWARAELGPRGRDRVYTVTATAVDRAGNTTTAAGTCTVSRPPADR